MNRLSLLDLSLPPTPAPLPPSDHNGLRLIQCPGIESGEQYSQQQATDGVGAAPCPSPGLPAGKAGEDFPCLECGWVS